MSVIFPDLHPQPAACKVVVGSVKELMVIPTQKVLVDPSACCDEKISLPFLLAGGAGFTSYSFPPNTVLLKESQNDSPGGNYYDYQISAKNDLSFETVTELCKLRNGKYIVIAFLYEGYVRKLGTKERPMLFKGGSSSGHNLKNWSITEWEFIGSGLCPAPYLDENLSQPFTSDLLSAALGLSQGDPYSPIVVSAQGSSLLDGSALSATTAGSVRLYYSFGPSKNPYFKAWIAPNANPANISNWNWVGGTESFGDFEEQIVDEITGGTGYTFSFYPQVYLDELEPSSINVSLYIQEGGIDSMSVSRSLIARTPPPAYKGQLSGSSISINHELKAANLRVEWGDGNKARYSNISGAQNLSHSYSGSGTYNFAVYVLPDQVTSLEIASQGLTGDIDAAALTNLRSLDLSDNNLASINLAAHPQLESLLLNDNTALASPLVAVKWVSLTQLNIENTAIPSLSVTGFMPVTELRARNTGLTGTINLCGYTNLTVLDIALNPGLSGTLDLSCVPTLEEVYAFSCGFDSLIVGSQPSLTILEIEGNASLTGTLDISGALNLEHVYAHLCDFDTLITGVQASMTEFLVWNNFNLTGHLDCTGWFALEDLSANDTGLTTFTLDSPINLDVLQLHNSQLTNISAIVNELHLYRTSGIKGINLTNNASSPDATALAQINGTGAYAGEGLIPDYGWTVYY